MTKKYYLVMGEKTVYSTVPFTEYVEAKTDWNKDLLIDIALSQSGPTPGQLYDGITGEEDEVTKIVEITEEEFKKRKRD